MNLKKIGLLSLLLVSKITLVQASSNYKEEEKAVEIRPLSQITKSELQSPSQVDKNKKRSSLSRTFKDCGICCSAVCTVGLLVTGATFGALANSTSVENNLDVPVDVIRQYMTYSQTRTTTLSPGEDNSFPHGTFNSICIKKGNELGCYSDEQLSHDKGCLWGRLIVNSANNSKGFSLDQHSCKPEDKRRLSGFTKTTDFMTQEDINKYLRGSVNFK